MQSKEYLKSIFITILFFIVTSQKTKAGIDYNVIIDSIIINGNNKTQSWIIENELLFKYKEIYKKSELAEMAVSSKNLLINTNLFVFVDVTFNEYKTQHIIVNVDVNETWYLWPMPCFELSDRNFKQWQNMDYKLNRTNYGLYLFKYNLKGRNETIKIALINGYTEKYGIYYSVPSFKKSTKFGVEFSTLFKRNKEIWYITKNNKLQFYKNYEKPLIQRWENYVSFNIRKNNFVTEKWEIEFNNIKIDEQIIKDSLNRNFLLGGKTQNEINVKHTFLLEKRDNKYYPLSGFSLKNEIKLGTIKSNVSAEMISEMLETSYYLKAAKNFYTSAFFKLKISNQIIPYIPYYNFKALGYSDYVRGYEQYVIDGHAFVLAKLNFKYALLNRYKLKIPFKLNKKYISLPLGTYLNLFADGGKTYNNQWQESYLGLENNLANRFLFGYGTGIDFVVLNDKILRIEYSMNILNEKNLNIHFKKAF